MLHRSMPRNTGILLVLNKSHKLTSLRSSSHLIFANQRANTYHTVLSDHANYGLRVTIKDMTD